VLPLRHENRSASAIAISEAYFSAILDNLRSAPEFEFVHLTEAEVAAVDLAAATATGSGRIEMTIADHYDADGVITGTNEAGMLFRLLGLPDPFSWRLTVRGQRSGSISDFGLGRRTDDLARFEQEVQLVARGLRYLLAGPETRDALLANLLENFVDSSRSENDRLTALIEYRMNRMRAGRIGEPLPEAAVSAMIELGSTATNPQVRRQIWRIVQAVPQAEFRGALLQALLYDSSEAVRREAANALAEFPDATASTREILALQSNANILAGQAFRDEWLARDTDSRYAYVLATLLDTDLTGAERISAFDRALQLASSPEFVGRLRSDERVLAALGDIAVSADDTRVRVVALRELAKSGHPGFIGLFIEHLGAGQPLDIRLTAANALWEHYADNAEAEEALRRVREE
jgi:HEAT repeat protein